MRDQSVNSMAQTDKNNLMKRKELVVIIQRRLTHYRVPLFEELRSLLGERDVQLRVIVGEGTEKERSKQDAGELAWAVKIPTRYWLSGKICWQPTFRYIRDANMVIVTQESSQIASQLLVLFPFGKKVAFWGHGANFQSADRTGLRERYKAWISRKVDWWFAYTEASADVVKAIGFPAERITVLNNAVGTAELQRQLETVTIEDRLALREALGFGAGPVGIYIGSLYAEKRLDFLFAAADAIHQRVQSFCLLIVGDGPDREKIQAWCSERRWAQWVGARFGRDKTAYLSIANVILNPGAVGLSILDSFGSGVPLITTDCGTHGPEIAYLENGHNGLMTTNDLNAYVAVIVNLLIQSPALEVLRSGCAVSANKYTVEKMAQRFVVGIGAALI